METTTYAARIRGRIFASGMRHMQHMCNLADPSFASVYVPQTEGMWNIWKKDGSPSEPPYMGESDDDDDPSTRFWKKIIIILLFLFYYDNLILINSNLFWSVGGLIFSKPSFPLLGFGIFSNWKNGQHVSTLLDKNLLSLTI